VYSWNHLARCWTSSSSERLGSSPGPRCTRRRPGSLFTPPNMSARANWRMSSQPPATISSGHGAELACGVSHIKRSRCVAHQLELGTGWVLDAGGSSSRVRRRRGRSRLFVRLEAGPRLVRGACRSVRWRQWRGISLRARIRSVFVSMACRYAVIVSSRWRTSDGRRPCVRRRSGFRWRELQRRWDADEGWLVRRLGGSRRRRHLADTAPRRDP
jgi:hypothetical protein